MTGWRNRRNLVKTKLSQIGTSVLRLPNQAPVRVRFSTMSALRGAGGNVRLILRPVAKQADLGGWSGRCLPLIRRSGENGMALGIFFLLLLIGALLAASIFWVAMMWLLQDGREDAELAGQPLTLTQAFAREIEAHRVWRSLSAWLSDKPLRLQDQRAPDIRD
jgi:hypothetical protein